MTEEELKKDALERWSKALRKERFRKRCGTFDRKKADTEPSGTKKADQKTQ